MLCYKDKTFCPFTACRASSTCDRAYTETARQDAVRWWGNDNAPIALWSSEPRCYNKQQETAHEMVL